MRSLWLWVWLLIIAVGLGSLVVAAGNPDRGAWVPLTSGSLLITVAMLIAVGLAVPQLGRRLLGRAWPGQFAQHQQRRLAIEHALAWLSSYALFGSSAFISGFHCGGW